MTEPKGGLISFKALRIYLPQTAIYLSVLDTDNLYVAIRTYPNAPVFVCS
jgi:hypothetical protein